MGRLRIDKVLADLQAGTRSEVKKIIRQGRVSVDDVIVKNPEMKVDYETQKICLDNNELHLQKFVYYMLNKPAGCVTATKDQINPTVMDYMKEVWRKDLFPVGRLDLDTEGLLLITNDGELAHKLLSPRKHVDKVYYAELDGSLRQEMIGQFQMGLNIGEEKITLPADLEILSEHTAKVTIHEGKYHQVKRMFQTCGLKVTYLKRVRMGTLLLDPKMQKGEFRELTQDEIIELKSGV
ncbi:MAG: rRNA pseudouridine synthase [Clostridia bacterium]|nr:rRNA pseudouridine synthase [Clostridia bacterium]